MVRQLLKENFGYLVMWAFIRIFGQLLLLLLFFVVLYLP